MNLKKIIIIACIGIFSVSASAQGKFFTKTGKIVLFSSAPIENISAANKSVVSLLDSKTGDLQFAALMKGFEFSKALMQEHFNSEYVESDKFPKAEFKGQITNNATINYNGGGSYEVNVKGKLSIHGQTKDIEVTGTVIAKGGIVTLHSSFDILLADFKVSIPRLYTDNISKTIKITVDAVLNPMTN